MTTTSSVAEIHGILQILVCPQCRQALVERRRSLECPACAIAYPVVNGIPDLRPHDTREKAEAIDWSAHWAEDNQRSFAQRFFSWYRKAVFARTVAYFTNRYFPMDGVFVEAGCGTAETSMRVNKGRNRRVLVAVDLIPQVLEHCHPVMDQRLCADIFRLPFEANTVDGIWNVGVMEHFTHSKIDEIMAECRRVLKPGGRLIMLWPAVFSVPQRMLRIVEWFINLKRKDAGFRFHPDEISQIRSIREGREVLTRNGYRPVRIDPGFFSLAAFETIVGEKRS